MNNDNQPLLVGGSPYGLAHLLVGSAAACGIGKRLDVRWVPLMSAQPWEMCCECQAKANKRGMIPQSGQNP